MLKWHITMPFAYAVAEGIPNAALQDRAYDQACCAQLSTLSPAKLHALLPLQCLRHRLSQCHTHLTMHSQALLSSIKTPLCLSPLFQHDRHTMPHSLLNTITSKRGLSLTAGSAAIFGAAAIQGTSPQHNSSTWQ